MQSELKPNRVKKQQRMLSKDNLPKYYQKVTRVPSEKGKKAYTKIVSRKVADKLINGVIELDAITKTLVRRALSRQFVLAK